MSAREYFEMFQLGRILVTATVLKIKLIIAKVWLDVHNFCGGLSLCLNSS
jgi:hypothetical protein